MRKLVPRSRKTVHSPMLLPWDGVTAVQVKRPWLSTGVPGGSAGKEPACNAGDPASIPGLGRSPGEGNGNPLQYSCLENSEDRGA